MLQIHPKILIADDSQTNRLVLSRLLSEFPAEVIEARSGTEAIAAARDHDFALILLDVQMPGLDGFEAVRRLRQMPRAAATPVILISAELTEPSHRRLGYELGAVDYLFNKPLEPEMLRQKVRVFLDLYRKRVEMQQLAARVQDENDRLNRENEEFRTAREELVHRATHDPLTGLPNRVLFDDRLRSAIQRCARNSQIFGLIYVDLDKFKNVNDRFGHAAGDEMLTEMARRLTTRLRASDTVARLSGDEFVILIEGLVESAHSLLIAEKLREQLAQPAVLSATARGGAETVVVTASLGVAAYPADALDADGLLMLADLAMYRAKQAGGNSVQLYSSEIPVPDPKVAAPDSEDLHSGLPSATAI